MGKDYSEILSSLEEVTKEKYDWMGWKLRIENLIEAAIEIAHSREDWSIYGVLNATMETLTSERGSLLDELLEKLDWYNEKEDFCSAVGGHPGTKTYARRSQTRPKAGL